MMSFVDLLGPLTCAPVQSNCQSHWDRIQGVLGIVSGAGCGDRRWRAGRRFRTGCRACAAAVELRQQKSGCSTTGASGGGVWVCSSFVLLSRTSRRSASGS
jgi:hypothetical protein